MTVELQIRAFFDEATNSVSYLVADPVTRQAAAIDAVLDFDPAAGEIATRSADRLIDAAAAEGWTIAAALETHVHADHLSAGRYVKQRTGAWTGIGEHILDVQRTFAPLFFATDITGDGSEFDRLFRNGERFRVGELEVEVIHTPGHTPACVTYRIADAAFVGDTLFMPDFGTARTDFPGGSARELYRSIRKLLALPPGTRLFMCHDYKAPGREEFAWEATVMEQRERNPHIHDGVSEQDFVTMRQGRDSRLPVPKLLLPAIQVNMRGGRLPDAEANGTRYLRIPLRGHVT